MARPTPASIYFYATLRQGFKTTPRFHLGPCTSLCSWTLSSSSVSIYLSSSFVLSVYHDLSLSSRFLCLYSASSLTYISSSLVFLFLLYFLFFIFSQDFDNSPVSPDTYPAFLTTSPTTTTFTRSPVPAHIRPPLSFHLDIL